MKIELDDVVVLGQASLAIAAGMAGIFFVSLVVALPVFAAGWVLNTIFGVFQ